MIIKSCGHCDEINDLVIAQLRTGKSQVLCLECGARGPLAVSPKESLDKWNERTPARYRPVDVGEIDANSN